jgi:hypothetical protein
MFIGGVNNTGDQLFGSANDTADKHSFAIISANFRKKIETIPMGYSGARRNLTYKKKLKTKISCQTPFKETISLDGDLDNSNLYSIQYCTV